MLYYFEQFMILLCYLGLYLIIESLNASSAPAFSGILWITFFLGISVLLRKKLRKLWQIFLAHTGALFLLWATWFFGLYIYFSSQAAAVCLIIIVINIFTCIAVWRDRYKKGGYETQPLFLVCPIVMYVYGLLNKDDALLLYALIVLILMMLCHFICKYLQGTSTFFISNKDIEELPEKAIKNSNARAVSVLVVATALIMLLAGFFKFDYIFVGIGVVIIRAVGWTIYYIGMFIDSLLMETPDINSTAPGNIMSELQGDSEVDPLTNKIIGALAIIILTLLFIRMMIGFFRRKDPDYYKNTTMIISKDWVEVREDIKDTREKADKYPNDEKGRIRRKYKKEVKRKLSGKVNNSMTTGQILTETSEDETIKELTPVYNKVRYDK